MTNLNIVAGSRIHLSLADMGFASPRIYGGIGFMVDHTAANICFETSDVLEMCRFETLDKEAQRQTRLLVERLVYESATGAKVTLVEHVPQHVGLGSKTALNLSIIVGLHALLNFKCSREFQQRASGRGGGSGIGVHGFFEGGVIWDGGHARKRDGALVPSSKASDFEVPPLMARYNFPDHWRVALCLPAGLPIADSAERLFFERECPVDKGETLLAMAILYHGILPSFKRADFAALRENLALLNQLGFKSKEIHFRGEPVKRLLTVLHQHGFAAGMSSVGPLVFGIFDSNVLDQENLAESLCIRESARWLGAVKGLNQGARTWWSL